MAFGSVPHFPCVCFLFRALGQIMQKESRARLTRSIDSRAAQLKMHAAARDLKPLLQQPPPPSQAAFHFAKLKTLFADGADAMSDLK
jgi:hypothetical protein